METTENKKPDTIFEIDTLVAESYNSIAQWHNDDSSSAGLKQLSLELVEKISTETLKHIGLNGNLLIYKDEETAKKVEELKNKEKN